MAARTNEFDVIVLGDHPCTYIAALLLRRHGVHRVAHVTIPTDATSDRAVLINAKVFSLDPVLEPWRDSVELTPILGIHFLGDNPSIHCSHASTFPLGYCGKLGEIAQAARAIAQRGGITLLPASTLNVHRSDLRGVEIEIDGQTIRASALVVGGNLAPADKRTLGIPEEWDPGVGRRLCYAKLPPGPNPDGGISMSLDLKGSLKCGWLLYTGDGRHLIAECDPNGNKAKYAGQLQYWANVLSAHGQLEPTTLDPQLVETVVLPFAGALNQDNVADRTLLIGPAGGFYSACGEDIYPNVWSAIYAADALAKALQKPILQDALDDYRACWRVTLGLHLGGHQQNLRFLLPLIYKNESMTARLAEAILMGKDVVR
jgi:flavin-dependent dehydrogenase